MKALSPVLLLPLLGGAIFCWEFVPTRYKFYRRSGYEVFFMAAISGALLLGITYITIKGIDLIGSGPGPVWIVWTTFIPGMQYPLYLGACVASFALGYPAALLLNCFVNPFEARKREVAEYGDELEEVVVSSVIQTYTSPQLYMVTLSSGKVYIGLILSGTDAYGNRAFLTLLKFGSGYRTDKQGVQIETKYSDLIAQVSREPEDEDEASEESIPDHITVDDFEVTIPKDEIMQVSRFEPDLRQHFPDGPILNDTGSEK